MSAEAMYDSWTDVTCTNTMPIYCTSQMMESLFTAMHVVNNIAELLINETAHPQICFHDEVPTTTLLK